MELHFVFSHSVFVRQMNSVHLIVDCRKKVVCGKTGIVFYSVVYIYF